MTDKNSLQRNGFTLLEVILAMGLSFFLLAALYQAIMMQSQYGEFAEARQRRSQIARSLLARIAAEIRALQPPAPAVPVANAPSPAPSPGHAPAINAGRSTMPGVLALGPEAFGVPSPASASLGKLLHFGEGLFSSGGGGGGGGADLFSDWEGTESGDSGEAVLSALGTQPARLLGTSNRLLLMPQRAVMTLSVVDQYHEAEGEGAAGFPGGGASAADPTQSRESSPGPERVVLYLMRPNPDWDETANAETNFEDAETIPMYLGLVRQELERPWSPGIDLEARLQLAEILDPGEGQESRGPTAGGAGGEGADLADFVQTRMVADSVTSVRFRYHDGTMWVDGWERGAELPAAVEITVSFDPEDGFDEGYGGGGKFGEASEELTGGETTEWDEIIEEDLPFRLVVALPGSRINPVQEAFETAPREPFAQAGREERAP